MNSDTTIREKIKEIMILSCDQECSNGSERDYRAIDSLLKLFADYVKEKHKKMRCTAPFDEICCLDDLLSGLEE